MRYLSPGMRVLASLFFLVTLLFGGAPLPDKQLLGGDLLGGYQVIACDVNGDGKQDLIAVASGMTDLLWFENPSWQRHVMAANLPHMINAACWEKQNGSTPTVAIAYEFSTHPAESLGIIAILTANGDPRKIWSLKEIDRLPTSHRLRWASIDGSANKVLINAPLEGSDAQPPNYRGQVPLVLYRPGDWKRELIGNFEEGIQHGIFVTRWDQDQRDAILIGSFLGIHLYRFGSDGRWSRTEIAKGDPSPWPRSGTSDIAVGRLKKERFLAAIEPWHGNEVVVYRNEKDNWHRSVIDNSLLDAHTLATADLSGNGEDTIIVGFRGKPYGVYLYSWSGHEWERHIFETGELSASGCAISDFDGAGKPGLACIGSATHNLILYRNLTESSSPNTNSRR